MKGVPPRTACCSPGTRLLTPEGIEVALRFFVAPLCQVIDPAGEEDLRAKAGLLTRSEPHVAEPALTAEKPS